MSINYHFIDQAFKEIFLNKRMVASLLRDIVKEPWTQEVDIHNFPDTYLREMGGAVSEFMLLENTDFKKQEKAIQRIINVLREIKQYNPEVFMLLKRYILGFMEKKSIMKTDRLNEYLFQQEEKGMLVESYFEVMEEKEKQGMEKAKREDTKRMLEKKYPIQDISEITGLSISSIERLKE
ncbi:MAG: hypothetical protein ACLFR1_12100 [Spirochaetia bacterium]